MSRLAGSCEVTWHGHLARDSLRHFLGNRAVFTGKMPVPRLRTFISQLPLSWLDEFDSWLTTHLLVRYGWVCCMAPKADLCGLRMVA